MDGRLLVAVAAVRAADLVADLLERPERDRVAGLPDGDAAATAAALLRLLLSELTGQAPAAHGITRSCGGCGSSVHGRPRVQGLHVSVARTPLVVAAAATRQGSVGVDVELVARAGDPALDPVLLAPGERVPTPEERTRLWTRKEAALKAGGVGLAVDPRSVGVRGDRARWPGGSARLLDVPAPGGARCSVAVLGGARPRLVVLDGEALLSRAGEAAREGRPSGGAARPGRCAGGSRRW